MGKVKGSEYFPNALYVIGYSRILNKMSSEKLTHLIMKMKQYATHSDGFSLSQDEILIKKTVLLFATNWDLRKMYLLLLQAD